MTTVNIGSLSTLVQNMFPKLNAMQVQRVLHRIQDTFAPLPEGLYDIAAQKTPFVGNQLGSSIFVEVDTPIVHRRWGFLWRYQKNYRIYFRLNRTQ